LSNLKLTVKVLVLIAIVSIAPIVFFVIYSDLTAKGAIMKETERGLSATFKGRYDYVTEYFAKYQLLEASLANDASVKGMYEDKNGEVALAIKTFDDLRKAYPNIEGIFVILKSGKTYTSPSNFKIASSELYQEVLSANSLVIKNEVDSQKHTDTVIFSEKIMDFSGKMIGVAGFYLNPVDLTGKISSFKYGENGLLFVAEPNGTVSLASVEKKIGENLSQFNWWQTVKDKNSGNFYYTYNGQKKYGIFKTLPTGDKLIISVRMSDVMADASKASLILIIVGTIIGAAAVVFGILAAIYWFVNPIKALIPPLNAVAAGNLRVKIPTKGKDEIAEIGKALDETVKSLRNTVFNIVKHSKNVSSESQQLSSTAEEVSATVEEATSLIDGVNSEIQNVSASVQETSASTEEVASAAQNVSNSIQEISDQAQEISSGAEKGNELLESMKERFREVNEASKANSEQIKSLADSTQNIGQIVEEINKIAEQTNLLALNAAIEAARAGEAGKGFAVVADEIRNLAENSKLSTQKIANILEAIVDKSEKVSLETEKSVGTIEKASEEIEGVSKEISGILGQIKGIMTKIESVAAASEEAGASAEEIASAMGTAAKMVAGIADKIESISSGIKQSAEASQNLAKLSEELNSVAEEMDNVVNSFKM